MTGIGQGGRTLRLITNSCRFRFPGRAPDPSPDLLALAAFSMLAPWVPKSVQFDPPVSAAFAELLSRGFGIDAGPIGNGSQRSPGSTVGLAYSGGADSITCSTLLPNASPMIHYHRIPHPRVPNRATHLQADLQAELVRRATLHGHDVYIVGSDAEFLTSPFPMFPVWVSLAVPVILMADDLELGGVGFGTIMGSRYLANGSRYKAPPAQDPWSELFTGTGLPYVRPTAGMTEVSTLRLAALSELGPYSRSCLLGTAASPCFNCSKCLRKDLVTAGIEDRPLNPRLLDNLQEGHPVVAEFSKPPPYYFQHVVEFGLARARGIEDTFLKDAFEWLGRPTPESNDWTTRFYRPALTHDVPAPFREAVRQRVEAVIDYMSPEDEAMVESWDASSRGVLAPS